MDATKGSGPKSKSIRDFPEVDVNAPSGDKIMVKMLKNAEGLNVGEIGRFRRPVVLKLLSKGHAELYRIKSTSGSTTGVAVSRAITALNNANDAKRLISKQMREVVQLVDEADQLTHAAYEAADKDLESASGGAELLVEQDKVASQGEADAEKESGDKVKEAKSRLTKAEKSLKGADDKVAGQSLIDEASAGLESALKEQASLESQHAKAKAARAAGIEGYAQNDELVASVESNIAELDRLREETKQLDEQLQSE